MTRIESPTHPAPFAVGDRIYGDRGPGEVTHVRWAEYRQWGHPGWDIGVRFDSNPRLPWVNFDGAQLIPEAIVAQHQCRLAPPPGAVSGPVSIGVLGYWYDCQTCRDRHNAGAGEAHRHYSCRNCGKRWADPS